MVKKYRFNLDNKTAKLSIDAINNKILLSGTCALVYHITKRETGNGKRETGNGKRETGNGKRETGNGKRETGLSSVTYLRLLLSDVILIHTCYCLKL